MNGGAAGGGGGGAAAALYNSRIKRWIGKEGDTEYFFILYPDESKPRRQQQIIRITPESMGTWQKSVKRTNIRMVISFVLMVPCLLFAQYVTYVFAPNLHLFVSVGVSFLLLLVFCVPIGWWYFRNYIAEIVVRQKVIDPYGTFDAAKIWTVQGRVQDEESSRPGKADYLLMEEGEVI